MVLSTTALPQLGLSQPPEMAPSPPITFSLLFFLFFFFFFLEERGQGLVGWKGGG